MDGGTAVILMSSTLAGAAAMAARAALVAGLLSVTAVALAAGLALRRRSGRPGDAGLPQAQPQAAPGRQAGRHRRPR